MGSRWSSVAALGLRLGERKAKSGDAAALCLVGGGNEIREQLAGLGAARRAKRAGDALIESR